MAKKNILWNTPVKWFAKSSGTTSDKSKFIPVSEESLTDNHYKASKDVLTNYYNNFPGVICLRVKDWWLAAAIK